MKVSGIQMAALGFAVIGICSLGVAQGPAGRPKPMTYAAVATIIKTKCAYCHGAKNPAGKLNLSTYRDFVPGPAVVPGHPEKSPLFLYITGAKKPRMPLNKPTLSAADTETVKKWIASGARGWRPF